MASYWSSCLFTSNLSHSMILWSATGHCWSIKFLKQRNISHICSWLNGDGRLWCPTLQKLSLGNPSRDFSLGIKSWTWQLFLSLTPSLTDWFRQYRTWLLGFYVFHSMETNSSGLQRTLDIWFPGSLVLALLKSKLSIANAWKPD